MGWLVYLIETNDQLLLPPHSQVFICGIKLEKRGEDYLGINGRRVSQLAQMLSDWQPTNSTKCLFRLRRARKPSRPKQLSFGESMISTKFSMTLSVHLESWQLTFVNTSRCSRNSPWNKKGQEQIWRIMEFCENKLTPQKIRERGSQRSDNMSSLHALPIEAVWSRRDKQVLVTNGDDIPHISSFQTSSSSVN